MKRALKLWLSFLALLTSWCILPQMTHAQKVPTHGNVSPHIYQDRDFFSQDQIDRLEKQNDELANSKQHQITKIFILSPNKMGADFKFPAKYMDINDFNDPENPAGYIQETIIAKKSIDSSGDYKGLRAAQAVRKYENVLVFIPEKNSLTFAASSFTSGRYDQLNWKKLTFGHKHQLNNSSSSQAKGVFKIATRINKQQLKLSQRNKPVKSKRPWIIFLEKFAIALLATSPLMIIWVVLRFGDRSTGIPDFGSDMGWYGGWSEREYYDEMRDIHDDWHDDPY